MLLPYDAHRAERQIREHATRHEFISLPQLRESLRADESKAAALRHQRNTERVVDWLKADLRQRGLTPKDDWNVLFDHFSACWQCVSASSAPDEGKHTMRRLIRSHAKTAGLQINLSPEDAQELADAVIQLNPGEQIPRVEVLGTVV